MKGIAAVPDLVEALYGAKRMRAREGAASGMCELGDESLVPVLLDATRRGRIRKDFAAHRIASFPHAEERLIEWFATDDKVLQEVALKASFSLSASGSIHNVLLAQAIDRALQPGVVPLAPRIRRMLEERIKPLL